MNFKNKISLVLILFVIIVSSCIKEIDVNLEDSYRKIVVNSMFSADSILTVNISKSLNVLDNADVIFIKNAVVKIYENDEYVETLVYQANGNYTTVSFVPVYGKNYKLTVSAPDLDDVESTNQLPTPVAISGIDTMLINKEGKELIKCIISIDDPANVQNYYYLQVFSNKQDYDYFYDMESSIQNSALYIDSDDPVIEEWVNWDQGAIFSDNIFNGTNYKLNIEINKWDVTSYDSTATILYYHLNSISYEYYLYTLSLAKYQRTNGDPFAEPVRVYSNITNGLGIFAGYSSYVYPIDFIGYIDYYYEW